MPLKFYGTIWGFNVLKQVVLVLELTSKGFMHYIHTILEKFLGQNKVIKQNWTRLKNFDIYF